MELVVMEWAINGREVTTETEQQDPSFSGQGGSVLGDRIGGRERLDSLQQEHINVEIIEGANIEINF